MATNTEVVLEAVDGPSGAVIGAGSADIVDLTQTATPATVQSVGVLVALSSGATDLAQGTDVVSGAGSATSSTLASAGVVTVLSGASTSGSVVGSGGELIVSA